MSSSVPGGAVLVGVDGTPSARSALVWAADEAARRRLPLHLVHAVDDPYRRYPSPALRDLWVTWAPAVRAACGETLEEARAFVSDRHPDLRVTAELVEGVAADALSTRAPGSSMVVVGARGQGDTEGEVGHHRVGFPLMTHVPCPVVVVREPEGAEHASPHIVVGVDGSQASVSAVGFAFQEAAFHRARLIAVLAWRQPFGGPARQQEEVRGWQRALGESTAGWQETYPQVEVRHELLAGHPVHTLVESSRFALALVVGRHGAGGFPGMRLGSVSQGVVRHARCPVVVVPPVGGSNR